MLGTCGRERRNAEVSAVIGRIAISAVHRLGMCAPALGFIVAEPTPHHNPVAIKKTTVLIIIIIVPRGWTRTSLAFASAATIYAARGRIGHAVAARSAATIGTAAVVIIIAGHVSLLYLLPGR